MSEIVTSPECIQSTSFIPPLFALFGHEKIFKRIPFLCLGMLSKVP